MVVPPMHRTFTAEEYLTIEREADCKSEFLEGDIYAMSGASPIHNLISFNLNGIVFSQLRGTPCFGLSNDMKIRVGEQGLYAYPYMTIVCGEMQFRDAKQDVLLNPVVIAEVLSPSTEQYDRTTKFDYYEQLESLQDYVLISQDTPRIEHFLRGGNGVWMQKIAVGLDASIALSGAAVTLTLADVYDRITFAA